MKPKRGKPIKSIAQAKEALDRVEHDRLLAFAPVYRDIEAALGPDVPIAKKLAVWKITQGMAEAAIKRVIKDLTGV